MYNVHCVDFIIELLIKWNTLPAKIPQSTSDKLKEYHRRKSDFFFIILFHGICDNYTYIH